MIARLATAVLLALALAGCGSDDELAEPAPDPKAPRTITVTSPAFAEGRPIPATYTCRGKGVSPPLEWSGVDRDTVGSLALVVDDPDAPGGDYVHWIVMDLPTGRGALDEGDLPEGARELDASGGPGWSPPCPPSGTHHYRFTVYAFPADTASMLAGDPSPTEVVGWLAHEAVAWGRLTGTVSEK